jgi:aryl-alcohol dehydrogenase-like predicted oxidoreductase
MINRREFLGVAGFAGAAMALAPELLRAHQSSTGKLLQRAIPSSGQMLPVICFNPSNKLDNAGMKAILQTLVDNGANVIGYPDGSGEELARTAANELGIQNQFFWTSASLKLPSAGVSYLHGRAAVEAKLAEFKVRTIDLVMVSAGRADALAQLGVLREMKKEGRVRLIGVHHLATPAPDPSPFGSLESVMRTESIDFIATDYSMGDRRAEEKILPLAQERKIPFMANFAFDRGRLFKRVGTTALPEWAAEFDARSWPQFFLKYVISHPAVTVARTGTTKAAHMLENIGGGIGRLPNEAMRKRMAELVDSLPATGAVL